MNQTWFWFSALSPTKKETKINESLVRVVSCKFFVMATTNFRIARNYAVDFNCTVLWLEISVKVSLFFFLLAVVLKVQAN